MNPVVEPDTFYITGLLLVVVAACGILSGVLAIKAIGRAGFTNGKQMMVVVSAIVISLVILFILEAIFEELRYHISHYFFALLVGCCCFLGTFLIVLAILFARYRRHGINF